MLKRKVPQIRLNRILTLGVKSMRHFRYIALILLLTSTENLCQAAVSVKSDKPVKVLIVDGFSNYDRAHSTKPILRIPEQTGRFSVDTALLTADYSSPFNGKDLTGWCYRTKEQEEILIESFDGKNESKDSRFTGRDGILTVNPWNEAKGPHFVSIWTTKDYQGDFSFTIEFRAGVNADSGIYLRGKQLQCRDYLVAGPYKDLKNYKPQDWNKIEVVVKDNIAHCTCNGEILEEALKIPVTGPMGLEADRGQMEYRNILIKALK